MLAKSYRLKFDCVYDLNIIYGSTVAETMIVKDYKLELRPSRKHSLKHCFAYMKNVNTHIQIHLNNFYSGYVLIKI